MEGLVRVNEIDVENADSVDALMTQYRGAGFGATFLGEAVDVMEKMKKENCTVFLSFTANLVASGLRGVLAYLARKKFVDAIVTTAGTIDHEICKEERDFFLADFHMDDDSLHRQGFERLGNMVIEHETFAHFEGFMQRVLKEVHREGEMLSPSELIRLVGKRLENKHSILRACSDNGIPVYCPGIVDGAIGYQMYFFKQDHPGFGVDVTKDFKALADTVLNAEKTGAICLGGGISKHHTIAVNVLRDGMDYAVYFTTATPYDGSLSGALASEAKTWNKIKEGAPAVTVFGDATVYFPLAVRALMERGVL